MIEYIPYKETTTEENDANLDIHSLVASDDLDDVADKGIIVEDDTYDKEQDIFGYYK